MTKNKKIKLPYKLLIWDIETMFLRANIWRPGEQVIRHNQLVTTHSNWYIITISYKWYGEKEVYTLDYTDPDMIKKFDKVLRSADVSLGKNSDSFDIKYINTQRMLQGLKPFPEWLDSVDDLQKQLKKYFAFPSQSLDYISNLFGLGGKDKMELDDWVDIDNHKQLKSIETCFDKSLTTFTMHNLCKYLFNNTRDKIASLGISALKKMILYNQKDVRDTEDCLTKVLPYITLKRNASIEGKGCVTCGSQNIVATKVIVKGKTKYQQFDCLDHNGYAGKCTWYYKKNNHHKTYGSMGN